VEVTRKRGWAPDRLGSIGVAEGHIVRFAISNQPVTFHQFARLFRDRLRCPDALFLAGSISALYATSVSRHDRFRPMGLIVGVVERSRASATTNEAK
jgi:uncharacterized protein YigE (DUF2233 family)